MISDNAQNHTNPVVKFLRWISGLFLHHRQNNYPPYNPTQEAVDNHCIMVGCAVGSERQGILEKFLPRSKGHIVAKLAERHSLQKGYEFDHLIISRCISFDSGEPTQVVSIYFSTGLSNEELCGYRVHNTLDMSGMVKMIREVEYHPDGKTEIGSSTYFVPGEIDDWKMEAAIDQTDRILGLLDGSCELAQLPSKHRLMQTIRLAVTQRQ